MLTFQIATGSNKRENTSKSSILEMFPWWHILSLKPKGKGGLVG